MSTTMYAEDEDQLFWQEMADVRPLRQDTLDNAGSHQPPSEAQLARRAAAELAAAPQHDHLSLEAVTLLDPHDLVSYKQPGVQEGVFRKLRLGQYPLQACLDLHGHSLREARAALLRFLDDCSQAELRCVLIRHGRGERGRPRALLKSYVSQWLTLCPGVLACHSAQRQHGGSGALYVLLRKSAGQKATTRERYYRRG